jgi:hypothetical protein
MIDFHLRDILAALAQLNIAKAWARCGDSDDFPSVEAVAKLWEYLAPVEKEILNLDMPTARYRIAKLQALFSTGAATTYHSLELELGELWDAIERDAREEYFCHYQKYKIQYFKNMGNDLALVFQNFSSTREEIIAGVDCYALGHNTACVFHMSRVGEMGLRIIAEERGVKSIKKRGASVPVEWATWGEVFNAIEPRLTEIRHKPNGPKKDAALAFYDTIKSDLKAIQSLYRDQTMHLRGSYDDAEAQSAMFRVRQMMTTLASKLDEASIKKIHWSAW